MLDWPEGVCPGQAVSNIQLLPYPLVRERSDLQEWVFAHPEIIGNGVLVVPVRDPGMNPPSRTT